MLKVGDFVRIQYIPTNYEEIDPQNLIDWSTYEGFVGLIISIEDGDAGMEVPEKMILNHKPPFSGAPLRQLKQITKEEFCFVIIHEDYNYLIL